MLLTIPGDQIVSTHFAQFTVQMYTQLFRIRFGFRWFGTNLITLRRGKLALEICRLLSPRFWITIH
jgi:hypothetical protein